VSLDFWGGGRQAGFLRLSAPAGAGASGLAWAPKVASAPRGPRSCPLAGNSVQSLPQGLISSNTLFPDSNASSNFPKIKGHSQPINIGQIEFKFQDKVQPQMADSNIKKNVKCHFDN
jgi:hypothetical protein